MKYHLPLLHAHAWDANKAILLVATTTNHGHSKLQAKQYKATLLSQTWSLNKHPMSCVLTPWHVFLSAGTLDLKLTYSSSYSSNMQLHVNHLWLRQHCIEQFPLHSGIYPQVP